MQVNLSRMRLYESVFFEFRQRSAYIYPKMNQNKVDKCITLPPCCTFSF
ncbi:unnamed protein product, partial [Amoebophrya sp. A120]|eukprot:GSA120T00014364001.1